MVQKRVTRAAKQPKTLFGLLAKAMSANPKFEGKFKASNYEYDSNGISYSPDDDEPEWVGHGFFCTDDFPFCCGLSVIGEFDCGAITGDPTVDAILLRIQLATMKDNFITATVVQHDQPVAYTMLLGAGFKIMAVWKNRKTRNEITMFGWDRATTKELPVS